jgi:hypothetical protein
LEAVNGLFPVSYAEAQRMRVDIEAAKEETLR